MDFPWKRIVSIGSTVLNTVVPGVSMVEAIARSLPALRGTHKQDAVLELVRASLATAENVTGRNLADDAAVDAATRGVIDAVVALNNILAKRAQDLAL